MPLKEAEMKSKWFLFLLIGLAAVLTVRFVGWLPVLTFLGCRVVDSENIIVNYENKIAPILEDWKDVISDWEDKANDPERDPYRDLDAESCHNRMQTVISAWDSLSPPDELKEYHLWVRHAMDYEIEAFRVMAEYYRLGEHSKSEEFKRLRKLATELWVLKDKALLKAEASYPNK